MSKVHIHSVKIHMLFYKTFNQHRFAYSKNELCHMKDYIVDFNLRNTGPIETYPHLRVLCVSFHVVLVGMWPLFCNQPPQSHNLLHFAK